MPSSAKAGSSPARKAGWMQIKEDIYQGLTSYHRLNMIYSENERREPAHPLYKARVLRGMAFLACICKRRARNYFAATDCIP